jgi:hypothetical protein
MDQLTLLDLPLISSRAAVPDKWHANPARLSFLEYMNRCIWGAPHPDGSRDCIDRKLLCDEFWYRVSQKENEYKNGEEPKYGSWQVALESGRSYLVGSSVPLREFVRKHSTALTRWQRVAYAWCVANPDQCLVLNSRPLRRIYEIKKRGEYIEIGLPHHDHGGEKHWISKDGKTKTLVNVD